ncbi:MAG: 3'-5' exonuclease, partial [Clostridiaceae bacterium]|nr:3'-5' exonuclease [Clostridiaceae bacterium]
MLQTTFKEYMHKVLGGELKKEDYYDMMEYILASKDKPTYRKRIRNIKYKSSMEFVDILKKYVSYVGKTDRSFNDIIFRGKLIISSMDLHQLYYKDYFQLPLKRRLQKIRERILFLLKPYEEERIGEVISELGGSGSYIDKAEISGKGIAIVREEMKDIYAEIDRITEFALVDIYKKLIENLELFSGSSDAENCEKEIDEIKGYTLENLKARQLYYEDQPPLLYLMGALGDLPKTSEIKYVIIDEAQDYTPLQYEIFYQLFNHADITMLGDLNQSINPFMNVGDYSNISHIFPQDNTCIMNLTKSYRSTMEITRFTRMLLNKEITEESVERHGDEPIVLGFSQEEEIKERILEDIKIYKEKGYKSIGIITRTIKEVNEVYGFLKDKIQVKAIISDNEEYLNDTVIIPAYLAKGLEFDVVLIYNAGDENYCCEEERLLFYTACTRALHVLCIYYSGKCTPLLQG